MPVVFRGQSEYKRNYKWTPSYRSASFVPKPDQAAQDAGLRSDQLGAILEPSFTIKKKVWHRDPQVQSCLVWWPDGEDKESERVATTPLKSKPKSTLQHLQTEEEEKLEENGHRRVVRESPSKRIKHRDASLNGSVIFAPSGDARKSVKLESHKKTTRDARDEMEPRKTRSRTTSPAKNKREKAVTMTTSPKVIKKSEQTQTPSPNPRRRLEKGEEKTGTSPEKRKELPRPKPSPSKEPKDNIPLQRKAGLAANKPSRISRARLSEYQRNYVPPKYLIKPSPLLSALDVVHSSSPAIPPHSGVKHLPTTTEYVANYKKDTSPLSRSLPMSSPASPSMKPKVKDMQNPQRPFFAHAKQRGLKSEYASQFETNQEFQVEELRKMAESNKQRHEGTHIDPEHATQVASPFNKYWEASSHGSSEITEEDDQEEKQQKGKQIGRKTYVVRESEPGQISRSSPKSSHISSETVEDIEIEADSLEDGESVATVDSVARKLAWGEESEEGEGEMDQDNKEAEEVQSIVSGSTMEGRVATPRLQDLGGAQRTHHDLTTPCRGGALLVSPSRFKKEDTTGSYFANSSVQLKSPVAGAPTPDAQRLLDDRIHPLVRSSPSRTPGSEIRSPYKRRRPATAKEPLVRRTSPTKEKISKEVIREKPTRHAFTAGNVRAPIKGMLRSEEFQHCGPIGRLPTPPVYSKIPMDEDALSVASSLTSARASDLLKKAQQRKSFWTTK